MLKKKRLKTIKYKFKTVPLWIHVKFTFTGLLVELECLVRFCVR